jgi:hypothetical protein
MSRALIAALAWGLLAAGAVGCGSSATTSSSPTAAQQAPSATATSSSTSSGAGAGALSADATSAATGDIPDNQIFLTYRNSGAGYSISYPEGWARNGKNDAVSFIDKNNIVRIVTSRLGAPTPGSLTAELTRLKQSNPTLAFGSPTQVQVKAGPAIKVTYTTRSAPNPVTGKSVLLIVDRYELSHGAKRVTVDLGTAKGVDNIDAYRRIINSLSWQ